MTDEIKTPETAETGPPRGARSPASMMLTNALFQAWAGSLLAGTMVFLSALVTILIRGVITGRFSIFALLYYLIYFTIAGATLVPMLSMFQIVFFGVPLVFIGHRFKLFRMWQCVLGGIVTAVLPWSLAGILLLAAAPDSYAPQRTGILAVAGVFTALGFCGGAGGWAFWSASRRQGFAGIQEKDGIPA